MKVLHLSTHDTHGGAAGSAYRLHQGLRSIGIDSRMYVLQQHSSDDTVLEHTPSDNLWEKGLRKAQRAIIRNSLQRYADTCRDGFGPFSDDRSPYRLHSLKSLSYDVLNLHWVAKFVDYRHFLGNIVRDTPVVWRLSDLNPFTGGCHYDAGCGKYSNRCGACPHLGSESPNDLSRAIWDRKAKAFEEIPDHQLHFVAQSHWIKDQVVSSPLTRRFPVTIIPNGLDVDIFKPRGGLGFRRALGVPDESNIVLFVAHSVSSERKGLALLVESLRHVDDQCHPFLLSVGGRSLDLSTSFPHLHLGSVESERLLSVVYSAADVFVIPSLQDNLPNTVLEAMACGTPVVGFDAGGIPDMVRPGETGWLASVGDVRALREALEQALRKSEKRSLMSVRCREVVVNEYSLGVQTRRYADLYRHLRDRISSEYA